MKAKKGRLTTKLWFIKWLARCVIPNSVGEVVHTLQPHIWVPIVEWYGLRELKRSVRGKFGKRAKPCLSRPSRSSKRIKLYDNRNPWPKRCWERSRISRLGRVYHIYYSSAGGANFEQVGQLSSVHYEGRSVIAGYQGCSAVRSALSFQASSCSQLRRLLVLFIVQHAPNHWK